MTRQRKKRGMGGRNGQLSPGDDMVVKTPEPTMGVPACVSPPNQLHHHHHHHHSKPTHYNPLTRLSGDSYCTGLNRAISTLSLGLRN